MYRLSNILSYIRPIKPIPSYNKLIIKTTIEDDTWNKIKDGQIIKDFYFLNENIGFISYRIGTGQIGLFYLNDGYRNLGLGKQILNNTIEELRANKQSNVWAVTRYNHPFWSNVYKKGFVYKERVHNSVTGDGYSMNI